MRVGRRGGQAAEDLPGFGVSHEQVDGESAAFGEERDLAAVGAEAGADVVSSAGGGLRQHEPRLARERRRVSHGRRGRATDRRMPVAGEGVGIGAELPGQTRQVEPRIGARSQERRHDPIAVPRAEVRPERVTPAVREVLRIVEVADARQGLVERGVAHPHGRLRVDAAERDVLSHAFDEPQRVLPGSPALRTRTPADRSR